MWAEWLKQIQSVPGLFPVIKVVLTVIAGVITYQFLRHLVHRTFQRSFSQKADENLRWRTLHHLLASVLKYVVFFIVAIIILGQFGINVTSILAAAGVVGLAVSFGAQALVKDIFTGFFIILEEQYHVGEYVAINDNKGTVTEIGMRTTKLKGVDGEVYIIPNGTITGVTNYCRQHTRLVVAAPPVCVDQEVRARTVMEKVIRTYYNEHEDEIVAPPAIISDSILAQNLLTFSVQVYTLVACREKVSRELGETMRKSLAEAGIKFPSLAAIDEAEETGPGVGEEGK